ncbi:MAG TPA: hypothetical protein VFE13_16975 [Caulobacteraceae bacterium]|jgi:hypothetical protein|nr:hypothetical protein [Caulobacteraceae bacterium]
MTRAAIVIAALGLACSAPAAAQPARPFEVEATYAGVLNALHLPGEMKVLEMRTVQHAGAADYASHAAIETFGLLRALKPVDIQTDASGPLEAGLPHPRAFAFTVLQRRKTKHVTLTWTASDVLQTPPHKDGGHPPPTAALKLTAADPVTTFSRAIFAPNGPALCQRNWRFFDGAQIYELRFKPAKPDALTPQDRAFGLTAAEVCPVNYAEIAGFTHRPGDHKADWLTGDIMARFGRVGAAGPWVFISLKADTFLGYAKLELTALKVGPP